MTDGAVQEIKKLLGPEAWVTFDSSHDKYHQWTASPDNRPCKMEEVVLFQAPDFPHLMRKIRKWAKIHKPK